MRKSSSIKMKKTVAMLAVIGMVAVLFSSCSRGYGCPGSISDADTEQYHKTIQMEQVVNDADC